MKNIIAFPGLGVEVTINRVAFTIFGKEIFWYGIIICIGFIIAALYASRKTKQFGYSLDNLYDLMLLCVPIGIICARIYYVVFEWDFYKGNPIEIFATWHGGIAIYGAIIGVIITIYVYGKKKNLNIPGMLDVASMGLIIGQIFGRWGNFVNAEAYGGVTNMPWGMSINGGDLVHPTFFYESAWNFIGFMLLHFYCSKRRFRGEIFLLYAAWYGFGRFWIESLRTDSLYLPGTPVRISQVVAAISFITALALLIIGRKNGIETLGQIWQPTAVEKPIEINHKKENDE